MFGHDNQDDQDTNEDQHQGSHDDSSPVVGGLGTPPPTEEDNGSTPAPSPDSSQSYDQSVPNENIGFSSTDTASGNSSDDGSSVSDNPDDSPLSTGPTVDSSNDLIDLKSKALNQLAPLVDHLDQTPEEKFKTTMMMIQASDNQALIQDAYEAAQQIPDEKAKAQALLDVVNEINYFTQHKAE